MRHLPVRDSIFLFLFTCLSINTTFAAEAKPTITLIGGGEAVYLGDSVFIDLEAVGIEGPLDTSSLFKEADLLRETTGTRITVINDRVVEMKSRRMELIPRREGRVVFGPVTGSSAGGLVTSNTVVINVQAPADSNWQPAADDLQIDVSLSIVNGTSRVRLGNTDPASDSPEQPWVGQHIIADMELRHRHPVADEQISMPDFQGFDVLDQYIERRTVDTRGSDRSWRITAWRYHLFAQRSGELTLGAVSWKGTAIRSRTQRATFDKSSQPLTLFVKPATSSARWWLPATEVMLSDNWSVDPRELSAGDEILRTITLSASDVLANHLPDIVPPESRALTTTPIGQTRSQELIGDHVTATAVFEFRMIAQSPIPVFLDTVRVPWYSTVDQIAREAIIPARRINVGLPDRADLLASLVLEESWLDRMTLKLQSSSGRWMHWHASLALLLLAAVWLWSQEYRHWSRERRQKKAGLQTTVLPKL